MKKYINALLMIIAVMLVSCAGIEPETFPFEESSFTRYSNKGTSRIVGSAFMRTRAGDVKTGAGCTVELIPATPHTVERFTVSRRVGPRDPRLAKYVRTTVADAQGSFEFNNIPAGDYILSCVIKWQFHNGSYAQRTGGQAIAKTTVNQRQTVKVILTK